MSDGFLHRYFLNNAHKRLHKWVHYFDIYETHFARFRNKAPVMLEIGVAGGGSLAMWKEYFGPGTKIIGLDVNPKCQQHEGEDIEVFIGSQDDPEVIERIFAKYPRIDIVLDDGSHVMSHMISTFQLVYDRLHPNGVYMVEDAHTSYKAKYEGGVKREGSFMEFVKDRIDELNAVHTSRKLPVTLFTRSTQCVACYDSIVTFERRPQGVRQTPVTGPMEEPTATAPASTPEPEAIP